MKICENYPMIRKQSSITMIWLKLWFDNFWLLKLNIKMEIQSKDNRKLLTTPKEKNLTN